MELALRLATRFITNPHMLTWGIHLWYGKAAFQNGWVGIKEDSKVTSSTVVKEVSSELKKLAGHVKITLLTYNDMPETAGYAFNYLHNLRQSFENVAKRTTSQPSRQFWYNPWDCSTQPTILLHETYA
jgi:hypothetical protein